MGEAMADVLSTLAFQTQRFDVVEFNAMNVLQTEGFHFQSIVLRRRGG